MKNKKTINKILKKLSKEIPIAEKGDILECMKTIYPDPNTPREDKNIILNSMELTPPLACSKEWKKMLIKEHNCICQIYKELDRGDFLKVKRVDNTKVFVENISIEEEFRKEFPIEKIEIAKKNFNLIRRRSIELIRSLDKIGEA